MKKFNAGQQDTSAKHREFDFFFNKIAWAAITIVVMYAASQLNELSRSVADLNKNMAVVASQLQSFEKQTQVMQQNFDRLSERVMKLEVRNGSGEL